MLNWPRLAQNLLEARSKGRERFESGGLVALFTPGRTEFWMNQAFIVGEVTSEDLESFEAECLARRCQPYTEFFPSLAPQLESILTRRGWQLQHDVPVMVLGILTEGTDPHDVQPVELGDLNEAQRVVAQAFGMDLDPDPSVWAQIIAGQQVMVVSRESGRIVAAGSSIGDSQIREFVGIGTLPEFRRRGHARAILRRLCRDFLDAGGEIGWLTPGDSGAKSLYEQLGFRVIGRQVAYVRPFALESD